MPAKAPTATTRGNAASMTTPLVCSHQCNLPLWDDAQIAQENWGSPLTANASAGSNNTADAGQDAGRQNATKPKSSGGSHAAPSGHLGMPTTAPESNFEDGVGHQYVTDFIQGSRTFNTRTLSLQNDKTAVSAVAAISEEVTWRRPVDIFRPFRPLVHRNSTPFVDPYASEDALTPMEGKVEEETCRVLSSAGGAAGNSNNSNGGGSGGKKSNAGTVRNADNAAAATETFHQQYPEAVTILEDFVGDDATRWTHCTTVDAIRRYRALPTLMQPYDGALVAGCAETPAEACGSRYSTALRHKLKQAEQLSALTEAPPFLMTALDSALLAVEQAQRYIPAGSYLWELIYPHAPGTCHPVYNPFGKYAVKLFVAGAYRKVTVDDRLPVDVLGRPLLTTTSLKELWPALIGKAVIKALGPVTGVQALTTSPDLIVSVLIGNWVPQYLSPRSATVSSTTALLLYERHLKKLAGTHVPLLGDTATPASTTSKGGEANTTPADGDGAAARRDVKGADGSDGGGAQPTRRRSSAQRKRASVVKNDVNGADAAQGDTQHQQQQCTSECCSATLDEPIPDQAMYVCGLHVVPGPVRGVANSSTPAYQLLTIHSMQPFRNTFALLLHTTPRLELVEGVFEKEKESDDVSALLRWGRHHQAGGLPVTRATSFSGGDNAADLPFTAVTEMVVIDHTRSPSVTSCWLTLEEFMTQMDQIVIWRRLDGKYAHTRSITGETVLQFNGLVGTDSNNLSNNNSNTEATVLTGKPAAAAGARTASSQSRDEAHAGAIASATTASVANMQRGGAGTAKSTTAARESLYSCTLSPTCVWWKLVAATAVEAVVVVSCPTLTEAIPAKTRAEHVGGDEQSSDNNNAAGGAKALPVDSAGQRANDAAAAQERRIDFHHFQWDRAEPLNHAGTVAYTDGALRSTVLYFRPGTHLLRVDLHNLQSADTIAFLSDALMDVQLSLAYDFSQDGFATVTDAGPYPAILEHDVEYIWLKRVVTLAKSTCLTVVLSTLDTAEDAAAHRHVNTVTQRSTAATAVAAAAGKAGKGGGASGSARGGGSNNVVVPAPNAPNCNGSTTAAFTKKNSSVVVLDGGKGQLQPQQPRAASTGAPDVESELQSVSILRYTTLLLVNLDRPEEFHMGSAGRLVKLRLEPNEKGYLVTAYTIVPGGRRKGTVACGHDCVVDEGASLQDMVLVPTATTTVAAVRSNVTGPVSTSPTTTHHGTATPITPLFPAGQWTLALRSDAELQSFDTVLHNIHEVTVEVDLPRGGSPMLFRRVCAVVEPTHLSLSAQLRTPLPMMYTVRITRSGGGAAAGGAATELPSPTKATSRGANTVSPLSVTEHPFPTEDGAGQWLTVYESEATEGRLFVADVLLPCTQENTTKSSKISGGGGGSNNTAATAGSPTMYNIEAFVAQASATAWDEECRRRQEAIFAHVRSSAEAQVAAMQQNDLDEFQRDPEAFLQRRRETAAQRRQQLLESAEKTVAHAQADAGATAAAEGRGLRGRSSSSSRRQSRHVSNAADTFIKDSVRRQSSSLQEDALNDAATLAQLDAADPADLVHLSAQFSFSSTRAELKEESPALDPVAELRQHLKETMCWLQERTGASGGAATRAAANGLTLGYGNTSGPGGQPVSSSSSGTTAKSQPSRNQKDGAVAAAISVEDVLHAKKARQSRVTYLRNPEHRYLPSTEVVEVSHSEGVASTGTATAIQTPANGPLGNSSSSSTAKTRSHDSWSAGHVVGNSSFTPASVSSRGGGIFHKESVVATSARLSSVTSVEAAAPSLLTHGAEVVLQDGVATRFRYAAPLTPSQYRVELLPLRSYEESTGATGGREKDSAGNAVGSAAAAGGGKRPKGSTAGNGATTGALKGGAVGGSGAGGTAATSSGSGGASMNATGATTNGGGAAGSGNAVSVVSASTLSYPLTAAECDAAVWLLQAPLLDAVKVCDPSAVAARLQRMEHRATFRASYQAYFEAMVAQRAMTSTHSSGDGVDTAVRPVVYHSLLGIKEEDITIALKSKKSTAAA